MSRSLVLPITLMLLLATGMAMLASAILLSGPTAVEFSTPGDASTEVAVVEQFYAAVNEAIATGSAAALTGVVHPSFADENPLPGVNPGRAGLEDYLTDLHDSDPTLRLRAEVIAASTNLVVTRVEAQGEAPALPTATPEAPQTVWSPIEGFRIDNGAIVGRWGHTSGLLLARPLAEQRVELPIPTTRIVSLMRVTLAPGTRWDAPRVDGPRLLYLEAGVLDVQADTTQRVMLTAGKSYQTPSGAITSTTSAGSADAHLLVVTFSEPRIPNGSVPEQDAGDLPFGVAAQVLAGDLATSLGTGAVTVTLERIAFAPDADLNLWSMDGPILLAVQTGELETTTQGTAWLRRSHDGMSVATRTDTQTPETSLMVQPGGMVALRNSEPDPASALVVTIRSETVDRSQ